MSKLLSSMATVRQVETQTKNIYCLTPYSLGCKHIMMKNPILCIPESYIDCLLDLSHYSLLGTHHDSLGTFLTIEQKFIYHI